MRIKLHHSPTPASLEMFQQPPEPFVQPEFSDQQIVSSSADSRVPSSFLDGGSWRKNLQDLISLLSASEECVDSVVTGRGVAEAPEVGVTVKEEPPSSPTPSLESATPNVSREMSRKSLLEKLEQSVNQSDLDWNAGLREEALKELNRTQEEYRSAVSTVQHQKELIENLEQDLLRVNSLQRSEAEGAADPSESPTELISNVLNEKNESNKGAADSLLPIVASQRERFRQRVQEVEEQNLQYQQHMALLQTEIEKMRSDNVKLFEKIKFLQSYSSGRTQAALPVDETVEKYSNEYEESIDPFRRFNIQERQRKYASLRTHDKATLGISRVMMSSSRTRAFFFFYFIFLHCLVFIVLYKLAYTESCKRDFASECVQKFREHMEQVHGQHNHQG